MSSQNRHITSKVVFGYILLISIAVCSVAYTYRIVQQVAGEEQPDSTSRRKVYYVTNTLSLLYESEALGQLVGIPDNDLTHFNRTLNKAHQNMDTLRVLISDLQQQAKIDSIDMMLEQKRRNTLNLLETWNEANAERLYTENIEKVIAIQDTVEERVELQDRIHIKKDTVVIPQKRRGFFRRLAEAFSPSKQDTNIVVNTTREIVSDTLLNAFSPSDTIVSVLKSIQDSVAGQRKQLIDLLMVRAANLRYNNSVITSKINQMLRDIEEEEVNASLGRMTKKQDLLRETSHLIAGIAIISVIIAVLFLFFIGRDISRSQYYRLQLEKAKQYAENLLRSREKLMLTISHDIRAPLSSIIGYIQLLLNLHPDERQRYYLENMTGSSNHILSLVNDLLDFHRLESGRMEIHRVPFNVATLFNEIYTSFKPLADAKKLQFVMNLKDRFMDKAYVGDPIRIRQIIGNLLSNAIKFTQEGRVVMVVSINENEAVYQLSVIVCDSGPGIPTEEQGRIFGEFTRLPETDEEEGFGLGLSITHKLISLMGGELSLQSTLGEGSDFTVILPLSLSDIPVQSPTQERENGNVVHTFDKRDICCLLVDDDPLQLALTEELLKQSHVKVVCCTNPHSVPELLKNTFFDAIITDIQMPGMDGFHLLDMIRTSGIQGTEKVPVIALSASVSKEHDHYLDAGFTAFLNKPFTATQLISLLNKLLTINLEVKTELNFSSLTAFAGEDKEASASILHTFSEETNKSIVLLQEAKSKHNREEVARLSHKLIPLFTMLGANTLVQQLRLLEKNDEELSDTGWMHLLSEVIEQAVVIVKQVTGN
ncbi:ATP-binding protein [Parabacteroides chinchillae]|uniref:histidine kinase n=1 Tax=Parabacteroides chinchillae TaxID=871327 RepID=A0A8G2BTS4_9BACT|nr:ATP-binding protein [Parabacteroides chinchillae]SEF44110.1 His Kinase A (phospho-acceptor) domain-containing protein [Parabacteroides chinchillae]